MTIPPALTSYFEHLAAGDFVRAAGCFTPKCFYSHPPYEPGAEGPLGRRVEATSRAELRRLFELRGKRDWHHETRVSVAGQRFFVEGAVRDGDGTLVLSYLSSGSVGESGLIERYVAYDSRPPVGQPL
ncbi:hypothetical protein [Aeromicrobium sp. HA]|uniref:hypothetical protein n=1 Tax=Aeromicrobium sp. HA TaxID=3009077 RepID=UPI0022B06434|nr:hypothetical protein [Aeromicrobium sp. HA]